MNNNKYVVAGAVCFVFFIFKFMEMRFFDKENKPLKELVKETILVFFSTLAAFFVLDQLGHVIPVETKAVSPPIFTGVPEF